MERWYSVANVFFLYGLPLVVILICYIQICLKSFSHRNCKSSDRPSGILGTNGTNTNEPPGASSVILPVPEDDEDEEEDDEDQEGNKNTAHVHGDGEDVGDEEQVQGKSKSKSKSKSSPHHRKKRVKVSTNEIKQLNEEVTNEGGQFKTISPEATKDASSADATSAVANGVKGGDERCKKVSPEEEKTKGKVRTKLKYAEDEDESDVNQMDLMDGEGQSMLMSSLTVTSTENRSSTSATKTTTDSVTCSTSKVSNDEGCNIERMNMTMEKERETGKGE